MPKTVYLGLGSNLGDRRRSLERTLEEIASAGLEILRVSSIYETHPVDYTAQPRFLNCVVEATTELMPRQLLVRLQSIENRLGRRRGIPKGPRTIDIDLLFYAAEVMNAPDLIVPHPRLHERRFVLEPLSEIAPGLRHPVLKQTVEELLAAAPPGRAVRVAPPPAVRRAAETESREG